VEFHVAPEAAAVRLARVRILIANLILCKKADRLLQSAHSARRDPGGDLSNKTMQPT